MECVCKRCDYRWNSKIDNPKECPKCKSHDWNRDREWVKINKGQEQTETPKDNRSVDWA